MGTRSRPGRPCCSSRGRTTRSRTSRRCTSACWRAAPRWVPTRRGTASRGSRTRRDRKSTRLNSSHLVMSYAVFCLKKKKLTPSTHDRLFDENVGYGLQLLFRRRWNCMFHLAHQATHEEQEIKHPNGAPQKLKIT